MPFRRRRQYPPVRTYRQCETASLPSARKDIQMTPIISDIIRRGNRDRYPDGPRAHRRHMVFLHEGVDAVRHHGGIVLPSGLRGISMITAVSNYRQFFGFGISDESRFAGRCRNDTPATARQIAQRETDFCGRFSPDHGLCKNPLSSPAFQQQGFHGLDGRHLMARIPGIHTAPGKVQSTNRRPFVLVRLLPERQFIIMTELVGRLAKAHSTHKGQSEHHQ